MMDFTTSGTLIMNMPSTLFFSVVLGLYLTGCKTQQNAVDVTVNEECDSLVRGNFIGKNGPEVCVTTPLSKSATSISGDIVGTDISGPFLVTALADGNILKQVATMADGNFTMTQLNLQNLPGKTLSFSVFVNGTSSPPTKLVVGQEPPSKCGVGTPDFPRCGTYPGAIFFPIFDRVTAIFLIPPGDTYGEAVLLPGLMGLSFLHWQADRTISFHSPEHFPSPIPGTEYTVIAVNRSNEWFAYPVTQTVFAKQK
jgi:hypothetical protein